MTELTSDDVFVFKDTKVEVVEKPTCPVCGSENLSIVGHCATCLDCGWSLCSM